MPNLAALLALLTLAACSSTPPPSMTAPADFALVYGWNTGSLPPPYYRSESLRLDASGAAVLRVELGYDPEANHALAFQLEATDVQALYADLQAAGLFVEWAADPMPPVGGPAWVLEATADGQTATVPPFVLRRAEAKGRIGERVLAAVPPEVRAEMDAWIQAEPSPDAD